MGARLISGLKKKHRWGLVQTISAYVFGVKQFRSNRCKQTKKQGPVGVKGFNSRHSHFWHSKELLPGQRNLKRVSKETGGSRDSGGGDGGGGGGVGLVKESATTNNWT